MKTSRNIGLMVIAVFVAACGDHAEKVTGNMPERDTIQVLDNNGQSEELEEGHTYQYTGIAQTIDGHRALIWEFADSEAYYLDEDTIQPWSAEVEGQEITIDGILVQDAGEKSLIKSWQILD